MSSERRADGEWMRQALQLAARGRGRTSPNPMVGAVVVTGGGVVAGTGYHERAGGEHAEVRALAEAGAAARGATLYCTLEPCCHRGRTGPCVERVLDAGVARVVVAMPDPNPVVNGRGIEFLRRHGIAVDVGLLSREAARLNEAFVTWVSEGRPFVTMKVATSLDARIAARPGERTALTSRRTRDAVHATRAEVDAIGVGSTTVLVDDPLLTARGLPRSRPLTRVIFDRRLRTPPDASMLGTLDAGPVVMVTREGGGRGWRDRMRRLADAGAELEVVPGIRFLQAAMARLAERGVTSLVLEGGRRLHEAAWRAGVVDRVQVYVAPVEIGREGVAWMDRGAVLGALDTLHVQTSGPDVRIEGDVHRTH